MAMMKEAGWTRQDGNDSEDRMAGRGYGVWCRLVEEVLQRTKSWINDALAR